MNPALLSCNQVDQFDLIVYLSFSENRPIKNLEKNYGCFSPIRKKKTTSLKVNRNINACYGYGIRKVARLIDFDNLYLGCSVQNFLIKLQEDKHFSFSFRQPSIINFADEKIHLSSAGQIHLLHPQEITRKAFLVYLLLPRIQLPIAKQFYSRISIGFYCKRHLLSGFKSGSRGNELRSRFFKINSSPRDATFLVITEGKLLNAFKELLSHFSFQKLSQICKPSENNLPTLQAFLRLHCFRFLEKSHVKMEFFDEVQLYLEREALGLHLLRMTWNGRPRFMDLGELYGISNDGKEYLISLQNTKKRKARIEECIFDFR